MEKTGDTSERLELEAMIAEAVKLLGANGRSPVIVINHNVNTGSTLPTGASAPVAPITINGIAGDVAAQTTTATATPPTGPAAVASAAAAPTTPPTAPTAPTTVGATPCAGAGRTPTATGGTGGAAPPPGGPAAPQGAQQPRPARRSIFERILHPFRRSRDRGGETRRPARRSPPETVIRGTRSKLKKILRWTLLLAAGLGVSYAGASTVYYYYSKPDSSSDDGCAREPKLCKQWKKELRDSIDKLKL